MFYYRLLKKGDPNFHFAVRIGLVQKLQNDIAQSLQMTTKIGIAVSEKHWLSASALLYFCFGSSLSFSYGSTTVWKYFTALSADRTAQL